MSGSFLQIGDHEKELIAAVKRYAEEHIYTLDVMKKAIAGEYIAAGDNRNYVCILGNHRVVYSIEEQPDGNYYHHLSVSVPDKGRYPKPVVVDLILSQFGINANVKSANHTWIEEKAEAVNVLQYYKPINISRNDNHLCKNCSDSRQTENE